MPTYDYQCEKCGFEFEREQRITEDPIKTCPECKARKVKRLLSAPNFILKGGGWYADGYGSSSGSSSTDADGSTSSASDGDASSGSDGAKKSEGGKKKADKKGASKTGKSAA